MPNSYDSLIKELKDGMKKLSTPSPNSTGSFINLQNDLPNPTTPAVTQIPELADIIAAFRSQVTDTTNTSTFLNKVPPIGSTATLQDLNTATNLVQFYFQITQPLDQIFSTLAGFDLSGFDKSGGGGKVKPADAKKDIQQISTDRQALQKSLNKALQEFGGAIDELALEKLLQSSNAILNQLKNPALTKLDDLSQVIKDLINHLKNAKELFKTFNRKSEEFTGNEPNEIKQLIRNWGEAVTQIEALEQTKPIQIALNKADKSKDAIAQSIQLHDLLEANYDYLAALVRSGDLESAGIL